MDELGEHTTFACAKTVKKPRAIGGLQKHHRSALNLYLSSLSLGERVRPKGRRKSISVRDAAPETHVVDHSLTIRISLGPTNPFGWMVG